MAYNGEKQCFECDCCGKKIPSSKVVQLCAKCEKLCWKNQLKKRRERMTKAELEKELAEYKELDKMVAEKYGRVSIFPVSGLKDYFRALEFQQENFPHKKISNITFTNGDNYIRVAIMDERPEHAKNAMIYTMQMAGFHASEDTVEI